MNAHKEMCRRRLATCMRCKIEMPIWKKVDHDCNELRYKVLRPIMKEGIKSEEERGVDNKIEIEVEDGLRVIVKPEVWQSSERPEDEALSEISESEEAARNLEEIMAIEDLETNIDEID